MTRKLYHYSGILAVAAVFGLAACSGDTGPQGAAGNDGLGYVPVPTPDQSLGEYDAAGDPVDQQIGNQLVSQTGVWEIQLDGQVQLDLGDGTPPVVGDTIRYDADFDELWLNVDGEWVPLTEGQSLGCTAGVPSACVEILPVVTGDYAELAWAGIQHGPATDTQGYAHYGVKTAAADMPHSGTATYLGVSDVTGQYTAPDAFVGTISQSGAVTINVDFGAAADQVSFESLNGDPAVDNNAHDLTGTATISGNSYSGTISGTVTGSNILLGDTLVVDGTMSGTFYGPAVNDSLDSETAGVFEASDTDPTDSVGSIVGGFFAGADAFVPAP